MLNKSMPNVTEQEFAKLKQDVDAAKAEAARSQGQLDSLQTQLQEEFGCASVQQAEKKLQALQDELEGLEEDFAREYRKYQQQWTS